MENKPFRENPDNRFDTEMRFRALEKGKESHKGKMEDENRAGVPSYDESLVSDWIRNRVDIPEDMLKGQGVFEVETVKQPEGDYEAELRKLQSLTPDQMEKLLDQVEEKGKERQGLFSRGSLVRGYAIDPQSLESLQSKIHDLASFMLAAKISERLSHPDLSRDVDIDSVKERIIDGLVYIEVPDFKTPIVKLYCYGSKEMGDEVSREDIDKITNYIKSERKFLPVSSDFRAL